MLLLVNGV